MPFCSVRTMAAVDATGGQATNGVAGHRIHVFSAVGNHTFSVAEGGTVEVLVVGGGGGGGQTIGGGGGGGGVVSSNAFAVGVGDYPVTVGDGGAGATWGSGSTYPAGLRGEDSVFGPLTALGGAGGAGFNQHASDTGGSGGGAGASTGLGGGHTDGQGNPGGTSGANTHRGAGGGGAGTPGTNSTAAAGGLGVGGEGLAFEISGSLTYYAGGGGGGLRNSTYGTSADGGLGGGGAGSNTSGVAGAVNTGGGGGAAGWQGSTFYPAGKGGSGIVIIRYMYPAAPLDVSVAEPDPIGATNATLRGQLTGGYGDAEPPSVYFCWGSADGGTTGTGDWDRVTFVGDDFNPGDFFAAVISGLESGSNTAYRAYVTNSTGEAWSTPQSFQTAYLPAVTNLGSVDGRVLTWLRGEVTDTGAQPPQTWFEWWAAGAAQTNRIDTGVQSGVFSNALSWLDPHITYRYRAGASNAAGAAWSQVEQFATLADGWYVTPNGNDSASGTSWVEAFLTVSNALAYARDDDTVFVSNGTYNLTATLAVTNGVRLTSVNGADVTVLSRDGTANHRVLTMTHADALVDGFTITNGYDTVRQGGGVWMSAGTLRACVIVSNTTFGNANASSQGGGVYMTGGRIEDCLIRDNWASAAANYGGHGFGGGIYMTGGTVERCRIETNRTDSSYNWRYGSGGGVYMTGGTLINSLLVNNSGPGNGGGLFMAGANAWAIHCTIADNRTWLNNGGGLFISNGQVTNAIIYYNRRLFDGQHVNIQQTGGSLAYCASWPEPAGVGHVTGDPGFADRSAGDYRLLPGSPCIDSGLALAAVSDDLDGNVRPVDGGSGMALPDMGCYEAPASDAGPLRANITTPIEVAVDWLDAELTAHVAGADTNGLTYWWDFENDGTIDTGGADRQVVTNGYGPGLYSVRLIVSNAALDSFSLVIINFIRVAPSIAYVDPGGNNVFPYHTWANAAVELADAVAAVSDTGAIRLAAETHTPAKLIAIDRGVNVIGEGGASNTLISGAARIRLGHPDLVFRDLSVINGAGIYMTSGTVTDCIITNNYVAGADGDNTAYGGGVRMTGGALLNSWISHNQTFRSFNASSSGGGVYITAGVVSNCVIRDNWATAAANYGGHGFGGGVYMTGGLVDRCRIIGNRTDSSYGFEHGNGGGVYMTGGTLRNALVVSNSAPSQAGGVYMTGAATIIEQVTVAYNTTRTVDSGGVRMLNGTLRNAIVYYNLRTMDSAVANIDQTGGTIAHTGAKPQPAGTGNIAMAPDFIDPAAGDFRLRWGSPCIDSGMALAHVALDLDGVERPQDGSGDGESHYDMGATERLPPDGSLVCNFSGDPTEGVGTTDVIFTAQVGGTDTNGLYYGWDFNANGFTDIEGPGLGVVTQAYASGTYSVRLTVSNAGGSVTSELKTDYIQILSDIVYVATNGTHAFPYDTWATAATNLQAAIDTAPDGGTVKVGAGTYPMSDAIFILKPLTVQGVMGAEATVISGGLHVNVNHAGVVFEGFTVTGGRGISMTGGIVRDCVVSNNYIYSHITFGGGVTMTAGLLERCRIVHNHVYASANASSYGGGLRMSGGTAVNCEIAGNQATTHTGYSGLSRGGGVYMEGTAVLINGTVTGNGVNMARNANSDGSGLYRTGSAAVTNTIVWDNRNLTTDAPDDLGGTFSAGFTYSCAPELTGGAGNLDLDPQFRDPGTGHGLGHGFGDYRLKHGSPCLDSGWTFAWMAGTVDLQGLPRVLWSGAPGGSLDVDMGAYETPPLRGTMIRVR